MPVMKARHQSGGREFLPTLWAVEGRAPRRRTPAPTPDPENTEGLLRRLEWPRLAVLVAVALMWALILWALYVTFDDQQPQAYLRAAAYSAT